MVPPGLALRHVFPASPTGSRCWKLEICTGMLDFFCLFFITNSPEPGVSRLKWVYRSVRHHEDIHILVLKTENEQSVLLPELDWTLETSISAPCPRGKILSCRLHSACDGEILCLSIAVGSAPCMLPKTHAQCCKCLLQPAWQKSKFLC